MNQNKNIAIEYNLTHDGKCFIGKINLRQSYNFLRILLPPSCVLPSFDIRAGNMAPDLKFGNVVEFKEQIIKDISFRLFIPKNRSFLKFDELLPQISNIEFDKYILNTNLPYTSCSLGNRPVKFISAHASHFYNSLISFQPVDKMFISNINLQLVKSKHFKSGIDQIGNITNKIICYCSIMFETDISSHLKLYIDWSEKYLSPITCEAWNSGDIIYLLVYGETDISETFLIYLTHEIIHEWNGRHIYPSTSYEWWFLEGVTHLLALKVLANTGLINKKRIQHLIMSILKNNGKPGRIVKRKDSHESLFYYHESFKYALNLDFYLQNTASEICVFDLLNLLLKSKSGKSISNSDIVQTIESLTGENFNENKLFSELELGKEEVNKIIFTKKAHV